jgi:hypothetical protein
MLSYECSLAVYEKQKCYMHRSVKIPHSIALFIITHEGKVVPIYTKEAYRGSRHRVSLILNAGTRWRSVGILPLLPLYTPHPQENKRAPLNVLEKRKSLQPVRIQSPK